MPRNIISVEWHGTRELDRTLRTLPRALTVRVIRAAAKDALVPVERRAWELAPKLTGFLADRIKIVTVPRRRGGGSGTVTVGVGPMQDAFYGMFHEFGTVKMAARPWLRPAWDTNVNAVFKIFGQRIWARLARAARRGR
jgi:HK97 gp10 family phage protein